MLFLIGQCRAALARLILVLPPECEAACRHNPQGLDELPLLPLVRGLRLPAVQYRADVIALDALGQRTVLELEDQLVLLTRVLPH
ncbi:MAG: hypothetical protein NW224_05015 [Leptolyngbyaceae cyanobacterium bins.302]|nr:hypothetical protein [Leptolyngbyaceae cyanobacterium bins.302]